MNAWLAKMRDICLPQGHYAVLQNNELINVNEPQIC